MFLHRFNAFERIQQINLCRIKTVADDMFVCLIVAQRAHKLANGCKVYGIRAELYCSK